MLVKIVKLPAFKAMSFHVQQSETPEMSAWDRAKRWAENHQVFSNPTDHQVFGRNNPIPLNNPPLRGYEFWITIPDSWQTEPGDSVIQFNGGLYAVVTSRGLPQMQTNWESLITWIQKSDAYISGYPAAYDYAHAPSLELEHHIDPLTMDNDSFLIDYYFPIQLK